MMKFEQARRNNIETMLSEFEKFKKANQKDNINILFFCDGIKNEVKVFVTITNRNSCYTEQLTYTKTYSVPFDDAIQTFNIKEDILFDTRSYLNLRSID